MKRCRPDPAACVQAEARVPGDGDGVGPETLHPGPRIPGAGDLEARKIETGGGKDAPRIGRVLFLESLGDDARRRGQCSGFEQHESKNPDVD